MVKKNSFTLTVLIALVISVASWVSAYADEPPIQHDYLQEVGEKFVFVMLSTDDPSIWAMDIQDENIRREYSRSGLYKKGESPELLWAVDWYAFQVDISSDGKYLVRWGDWPIKSNFDAMAFAFYENGQEIKHYAVNHLVAFPMLLPETTSHYEWKKDSSFDGENKILHVSTLNGEEFTFDITTGKMIKGFRPQIRRLPVLFGVAVVILMSVFAVLRSFRHVQGQRKASP